MEIGKANYGGGETKKRFKIVDGDNIYRILPPMGSLAKAGRWSQYWSVVWGYTNAQNKSVPFSDCRVTNFRTKMVEVESDAYLKAERIKAMLAGMKEAIKRGEQVNEKEMERAEKLVEKYNIDNKHYINAVNLKCEIGLLKIGAKAKQLIEEEIKKLMSKGIDPLSIDNGRYFNIFRSGKGFNTVYQVTIYKEQRQMENGEIAEFAKVHKMDEAFISRLESEAFDLGTLYSRPTPEQVSRIVNGEDPDLVLGINRGTRTVVVEEESDPMEGAFQGVEPVVTKPVMQEPVKVVFTQPKPDPVKPEPVVAKQEVSKPAPAKAAPAATKELSDAEWLAQMGIN